MPIADLVIACLLAVAVKDGMDDTLTPERLADIIEQQRSRADPFFVSFRMEVEDDEALLDAEKDKLRMIWTENTVAFDGPKQYCKTHRLTVRGDARIELQRTAVYTGERSLIRVNKDLHIQAEKSAYCSLNAYTSGLLWPVTEDELRLARELGGQSAYLPEMLLGGDWVVQEETEVKGGVPCRMIATRDGNRSLWLDPKRNYALMRYQTIRPFAGYSRIDTWYTDHVRVAEGLYLPRRVESVSTRVDPQGRELGQRRNLLTVSEIKVGPLSEELFDLRPKVNETIIDLVKKELYTYYPSDDRALDHSIEAARRFIHLDDSRSKRSLWLAALGSAAALVAGFGFARLLSRRGRGA